jgi:hypothetical protein
MSVVQNILTLVKRLFTFQQIFSFCPCGPKKQNLDHLYIQYFNS